MSPARAAAGVRSGKRTRIPAPRLRVTRVPPRQPAWYNGGGQVAARARPRPAAGSYIGVEQGRTMDGMYCCSYARFAVRAGIVAAIVGVVLFVAASLAGVTVTVTP